MSTKDFFSEPVSDDKDFQNDEDFADMQSFDLFEDNSGAETDAQESFAALSDVQEDDEVKDFSEFEGAGLFDEPETSRDKGGFGEAVYQSILNGDDDPAPRAKKQEYTPLTWPKAEPLRRKPQPAPAARPVSAQPQQPAEPVQPAAEPQPVPAPAPVQQPQAEPVRMPEPEPVYAQPAPVQSPVEDLAGAFSAHQERAAVTPEAEGKTQVFTMHSSRPAQPAKEEKAEEPADAFDAFENESGFSGFDSDFDTDLDDDMGFDDFGDFEEEEVQDVRTAAPAPAAKEPDPEPVDNGFDDFDDFGDFDDYEESEPEPSREQKLAAYADTLQNVFGDDDFGDDYSDEPEEEDYAPKAKKPNPFESGAWNDDDDDDGRDDDADDDDDDYDDDYDEPPRKPSRPRNTSGGGRGNGGKGKSNMPLVVLLIVLILAIIAVVLYALFGGKDKGGNGTSQSNSISTSVSASTSTGGESSSVAQPVVTIPRDEWYMKLVNKNNVMTKEECDAITTTNVQGIPVDSRIADALNSMIDAAAAEGVNLKVVSGFRSYDRQDTNYKSGSTDCPAGASEHNLGLSADIMADDETSYDVAKFEATDEYAWLKAHAAEYGFILRYPSGKESVTGFAYEPWHYRYVGTEQAALINASGLTLEEYLAQDTSAASSTAESSSDSAAQ